MNIPAATRRENSSNWPTSGLALSGPVPPAFRSFRLWAHGPNISMYSSGPPPPSIFGPTDRPIQTGRMLWSQDRSEEHTSELQSLMRISYAVFCLKKKKQEYIELIKSPR